MYTSPTLSGNHQSVLCIHDLVLILFFLDSTDSWDFMVLIFLWLISISTVALKVHSCCHKWQDCLSFLWMNNIPWYYIYITFFILPSIDGHVNCFHICVILNNATVNIGVKMSFRVSVFIIITKIYTSRIAKSYCSSIFNFLRHFHIVFYSDGTNLHF